MQQKAIIHSMEVRRRGVMLYAQVSLPGYPVRIVAVETGVTQLSPLPPAQVTPDSAPPPASLCPNPGAASLQKTAEDVAGGIRSQTFRVGAAVNPGFLYGLRLGSFELLVSAQDGDTPDSIAVRLAQAINGNNIEVWMQNGLFFRQEPPGAKAVGDLITVRVEEAYSFIARAEGACSNAPVFEELFWVKRNEKAGLLSLQSPDRTDIFFQGEVFRSDVNTPLADFTATLVGRGEWLQGRKRYAQEVLIETASPIVEVYYRDTWGDYAGQDVWYRLNLIIWYEIKKR